MSVAARRTEWNYELIFMNFDLSKTFFASKWLTLCNWKRPQLLFYSYPDLSWYCKSYIKFYYLQKTASTQGKTLIRFMFTDVIEWWFSVWWNSRKILSNLLKSFRMKINWFQWYWIYMDIFNLTKIVPSFVFKVQSNSKRSALSFGLPKLVTPIGSNDRTYSSSCLLLLMSRVNNTPWLSSLLWSH